MKKMMMISLCAILVMKVAAVADQSMPLSVEEMKKQSKLVFQAEIEYIKETASIDKFAGEGKPVVVMKSYLALAKVKKVIMGSLMGESAKNMEVWIAYKKTDDARFKGERVPPLEKGKTYDFYIEEFRLNPEGQIVCYVHNKNHVREVSATPMNTEARKEQMENAVLALIESVVKKDDKQLASLIQESDSRSLSRNCATVSRVQSYLANVKGTDVKFGSVFQRQEKQLVGIRTIEPLCLDFTFIKVEQNGKEVLLLQDINP